MLDFARGLKDLPPEKLPQLLSSTSRRLTHAGGACYWRASAGAFECLHAEGACPQQLLGTTLPPRRTRAATESARRGLAHCSSAAELSQGSFTLGERAAAEMIVPVLCADRLSGLVILIHSRAGKKFAARDVERVTALAAVAGGQFQDPSRSNAVPAPSPSVLALVEHVKRQWMEVIDAIVDFIVVHDEQHHVLRLNRSLASFLGVQPSQLVGVSMSELTQRAGLGSTRPCLFCRSGAAVSEEFALMAGERTYLVSGSQVQGVPEGLRTVHVLKDITDAATLRAQLLHAEKLAAIGQLVAGVAHEVNNPLTAIVGFAELLLEDPQVPAGARLELGRILQEAERTKAIVQDLLHFSRPDPPERGPVDIHEIIRRVLVLRSYDFKSHKVEAVTRFAGDLPEILGDTHQLQQVILNLLNNAYDATREVPRRGRIEIETLALSGSIEVRVCDNGPGILKPDRVFDPFFTTKEPGKGTGLGLSICYGIMQAHGGEIRARNNFPQPGCTFVLRLPRAEAKAPAEEPEAAQVVARSQK